MGANSVRAKYSENNLSWSFSVFDVSHSIDISIHNGVYSKKFIIKNYEPQLLA
jgi:Ca2+-binding EF-hand superfamily protein